MTQRVAMGTVARYVRERVKLGKALVRYERGEAISAADLTARVPCSGCTACCRSGLNVDLLARETGAGLDFELVNGTRRLRQNADGSCVHLVEGSCAVYADRPLGCRMFDCRELAVARLAPRNHPLIVEAVARWQLELRSADDRDAFHAVGLVAQALGATGVDVYEAAGVAVGLAGVPSSERVARLASVLPGLTRLSPP